jgi:large subunit ribosomal protein L15
MPLVRRLPKRGFKNIHRKPVEIVNVGDLARLGDGATADVAVLSARGLIRGSGAPVKLLGHGDAPKGCTVKVHRVSGSAKRKIEEAGGTVEIIA